MPWVRKYPHSTRGNWIAGIVAGVLFGLLLGYERWGSTAAVVSVVEKELTASEVHIRDLENRLVQLEAKLLSDQSSRVAAAEKASANKTVSELTQSSAQSAFDPVAWRGDTY